MKVNLSWLNELIDISDLSVADVVDTMLLYSAEVEEFGKLIDIDNLVVGRVMIKEQHPDADKLSVCTVNVGDEILKIVCGADNVRAGQDVIVAKVGAVLPGDFHIKKAKIRGVESFGMICSLSELGLDKKFIEEEYQDGIYYFKEPVKIGTNPLEKLGLDSFIIELDLTPDRGDLLNMLGIAIEMSALFNRPLKQLAYEIKEEGQKSTDFVSIENESDKCLSYYLKVFTNVVIKPSPAWLTSRLIGFGIRPINNVVDITNYILALFGQPLHSFDLDKLGNKVLVRQAKDNEMVITLDNEKRTLDMNDLVITDGSDIVAIAGVMGALNTEVTEKTTKVALEAAVFDPASVRRTSQKLGLISDSSTRFSRGVDVNRTKIALDYATHLFETLAEATAHKDYAFVGIENIEAKQIPLDIKRLNKHLGTEITKQDAIDILTRLGFGIKDDKELIIWVPNRRFDITIEEDLYEEVIRLYGYHKLPSTLPAQTLDGGLSFRQQQIRLIEDTLSTLGLNLVTNYTLVSKPKLNLFNILPFTKSKKIDLLMPLTEERTTIGLSLLPNLLDNVKHNLTRQSMNVKMFEIANIYYYENKEVIEKTLLSGVLTGEYKGAWNKHKEEVDFYLVKGILEVIFKKLSVEIDYTPITNETTELHPTKTALLTLNNEVIGYVGELHPQYARAEKLEDVYIFELDLDKILSTEKKIAKFTPLSRQLDVKRDIAVVLDKDVNVGGVINNIYSSSKLVSKVSVFDIYTGSNIKATEKSVAMEIVFSSKAQLTDKIINSQIEKIVANLGKTFNAVLRG